LISEINVSVLPPKLARSWKLPNNWYANTYLTEISPSGRFLSGWGYGTDNKSFLVERTETELKAVADFPDSWRIAFASDEKTIALTTRDGGSVQLFDFQNNKLTEKAVLAGSVTEIADQPMSPLRDAKFSPDGRLLVIDAKFEPWFYDVTKAEPKLLSKLPRSGWSPSFSKDGSTLIARGDSNGGGFHIWSIDNLKSDLRGSFDRLPRNWTDLPNHNIFGSDVSPDGKLAVLGLLNGSVKFLDIHSSDLAELHPVKPNPFIGPSYGRPLRIGDDGFNVMSEELPNALSTWRLENGRLQRIGDLEAGYGRPLSAAPDGSVIVNWETPPARCVIRRWEENEWRAIRTVSTTIDAMSGALSRDQRRLVVGSNSGEIELWDLEAKPARKLWTHRTPQNRAVLRLHYAMKESLLVSEVYGNAVVQRITDAGLEPVLVTPVTGNLALDVAPDGESMALVANHIASTWSLSSDPPQVVQPLSASQVSNPQSVAYAPDGRQLAVSYANGQIWLHDLESGTVTRKLQLPGSVRHVLFTTDNRHLITANGNGTIYVLRLESAPSEPSSR